MMRFPIVLAAALFAFASPALAGPPYVTDDPEPTDNTHFEIYAFGTGTSARGGSEGETGIDFNYGAGPDLQLTAVAPLAYDSPRGARASFGFGNIELAAKIRFLHRRDFGWDVSIFPRVLLPSLSRNVGDREAAFLVPVWLEKDWGKWTAFGGGGCAIHRGGSARDYCIAGWALTREVLPDLQLGAEFYYRSADTHGGKDSAGLGAGAIYDLGEHYHLLASFGPGIENVDETGRYAWYAALLFTF